MVGHVLAAAIEQGAAEEDQIRIQHEQQIRRSLLQRTINPTAVPDHIVVKDQLHARTLLGVGLQKDNGAVAGGIVGDQQGHGPVSLHPGQGSQRHPQGGQGIERSQKG